MNDLANPTESLNAVPRDDGGAALLVFPHVGTARADDDEKATGSGHGPASLFDRLGHFLGLDASIRRWMLVDRLAALIGLGISADEALDRLRNTAAGDVERDMIGRAIEGRGDRGDLADALAAAGGYPARGVAALHAASSPADEATALAEIAAVLRRRLTLRYSAAIGGMVLTVLLAGLALQHRQPDAPSAPAPPAAPAAVSREAPARAAPPADLAPVLGPGLAGAPPPLVGIVGRLPDDAVALVRMPSGRTRTLAVGATFDGWTLASLDADEAVFERTGQRVTVALPPADDQ